MGHHCCSKQKVKRGLWSPEEDEKLIRCITTHGHGCWSSVPKLAGLQRCGKSCRLRWINYLRPDLKRGSFSAQEERIIIDVHRILGNRWAQIAKHLPGRTDNEVKNFWNSCIKKKLIAQGLDPKTHNLIMISSSNVNACINHPNQILYQQQQPINSSVFSMNMMNPISTPTTFITLPPPPPPPPLLHDESINNNVISTTSFKYYQQNPNPHHQSTLLLPISSSSSSSSSCSTILMNPSSCNRRFGFSADEENCPMWVCNNNVDDESFETQPKVLLQEMHNSNTLPPPPPQVLEQKEEEQEKLVFEVDHDHHQFIDEITNKNGFNISCNKEEDYMEMIISSSNSSFNSSTFDLDQFIDSTYNYVLWNNA